MSLSVLALGGYGAFGVPACERLAAIPGVRLVIGGRSEARATALAQRLGAEALRVDARDPALREVLERAAVDVVVSLAGPFQGSDYHVAEACIAAGCHYLDIADARGFVSGIARLDADARRADVLVVSGVSSTPALTSAVLDEATRGRRVLRSASVAISTSERMPGLATVRGVLACCGKRFPAPQDGAWTQVVGWQGLQRRHIPGVGRRWLAHCEVPDLDLLPARHPALRSYRFRAGTGRAVTTLGVWLLSWLVRAGLVRDASALSRPLWHAGRWFQPFGRGRSALLVDACLQEAEETCVQWRWRLVAEGNDGVHIPAMGVVALVRKLAADALPQRGARPCVGLLPLADYLAELAHLRIRVETGDWKTGTEEVNRN